MDNGKILNQAIELLKELDLTKVESVQINNTKYDDGSTCVEVGVSFPATKDCSDEFVDIDVDGHPTERLKVWKE